MLRDLADVSMLARCADRTYVDERDRAWAELDHSKPQRISSSLRSHCASFYDIYLEDMIINFLHISPPAHCSPQHPSPIVIISIHHPNQTPNPAHEKSFSNPPYTASISDSHPAAPHPHPRKTTQKVFLCHATSAGTSITSPSSKE